MQQTLSIFFLINLHSFFKAAEITNSIPTDKFPYLLNRVIQKLHLMNAQLFNYDEEVQLKERFNLSNEDLNIVLKVCCYIFEQAAFTSTAPEPLYQILLDGGFDEQHAKVIGRTWVNEAPEYINKLKTQTLGYDALKNVDYHLNMVMGQSNLTRLQEPTALFEFSFLNNNEIHEKKNEKICVEFSQQDLYSLFNQLDRVQKQLDSLG